MTIPLKTQAAVGQQTTKAGEVTGGPGSLTQQPMSYACSDRLLEDRVSSAAQRLSSFLSSVHSVRLVSSLWKRPNILTKYFNLSFFRLFGILDHGGGILELFG